MHLLGTRACLCIYVIHDKRTIKIEETRKDTEENKKPIYLYKLFTCKIFTD